MMDVYSDTRQMSLFAEDMIQRKIGRQTFVAGSAPEFSAMIKNIIPTIVYGVIAWNRRRQIENELFDMSDHMLSDIGVVRGEIRTVARKWAATETNRDRAAYDAAKFSFGLSNIFSGVGEGVVDAYRAWSRRRQIENELYALSDHVLADINVRRNQIPAIALQWVQAEAQRDHAERAEVKHRKAAEVMTFAPATKSADVPVRAANDDAHHMAA